MQTWPRVYNSVCSVENLKKASSAAVRGRRTDPTAACWLFQEEPRLRSLRERLVQRSWHPRPGHVLYIRDPKPRVITAAALEERVVHHALCQVIGPKLERSFIHDTYACLKDRGAHRAVLRHQLFMRQHRFLIQLDIRKFFPSISHARLLEALARRFPDEGLLWLCKVLLEAHADVYLRPEVRRHLGDGSFEPSSDRGLPVGFLTSQVWGNAILDPLDHFIKREMKVTAYLRYMADLTLFSDSKSQLKQWKNTISTWLGEHLELELREDRVRLLPCTATVLYLGQCIDRHSIRPHRRFFERLERRLLHWRLRRPSAEHMRRSLASISGNLHGASRGTGRYVRLDVTHGKPLTGRCVEYPPDLPPF